MLDDESFFVIDLFVGIFFREAEETSELPQDHLVDGRVLLGPVTTSNLVLFQFLPNFHVAGQVPGSGDVEPIGVEGNPVRLDRF